MESMSLLNMLAEIASQKLHSDPTLHDVADSSQNEGAESKDLTNTSPPPAPLSSVLNQNLGRKMSLLQVASFSENNMLRLFSLSQSNELRRKFHFTCRLVPSKCEATFQSFGSEDKARKLMKRHLKEHLRELMDEYQDYESRQNYVLYTVEVSAKQQNSSSTENKIGKKPKNEIKKKSSLKVHIPKPDLKKSKSISPIKSVIKDSVYTYSDIPRNKDQTTSSSMNHSEKITFRLTDEDILSHLPAQDIPFVNTYTSNGLEASSQTKTEMARSTMSTKVRGADGHLFAGNKENTTQKLNVPLQNDNGFLNPKHVDLKQNCIQNINQNVQTVSYAHPKYMSKPIVGEVYAMYPSGKVINTINSFDNHSKFIVASEPQNFMLSIPPSQSNILVGLPLQNFPKSTVSNSATAVPTVISSSPTQYSANPDVYQWSVPYSNSQKCLLQSTSSGPVLTNSQNSNTITSMLVPGINSNCDQFTEPTIILNPPGVVSDEALDKDLKIKTEIIDIQIGESIEWFDTKADENFKKGSNSIYHDHDGYVGKSETVSIKQEKMDTGVVKDEVPEIKPEPVDEVVSKPAEERKKERKSVGETDKRKSLIKGKGKFIGKSKDERKKALALIEKIKNDPALPATQRECRICDPPRVFTAWSTLVSHYKSHAGIRPFACPLCNAFFTRHHSLNYHLLIHSNSTRFTCDDCGRKFRHPSHFKEHRRRHTGECPFKCVDCQMRFKTRNTYKRHLRTRHGKKLTAEGVVETGSEWYLSKDEEQSKARLNCSETDEHQGNINFQSKDTKKVRLMPEDSKDITSSGGISVSCSSSPSVSRGLGISESSLVNIASDNMLYSSGVQNGVSSQSVDSNELRELKTYLNSVTIEKVSPDKVKSKSRPHKYTEPGNFSINNTNKVVTNNSSAQGRDLKVSNGFLCINPEIKIECASIEPDMASNASGFSKINDISLPKTSSCELSILGNLLASGSQPSIDSVSICNNELVPTASESSDNWECLMREVISLSKAVKSKSQGPSNLIPDEVTISIPEVADHGKLMPLRPLEELHSNFTLPMSTYSSVQGRTPYDVETSLNNNVCTFPSSELVHNQPGPEPQKVYLLKYADDPGRIDSSMGLSLKQMTPKYATERAVTSK